MTSRSRFSARPASTAATGPAPRRGGLHGPRARAAARGRGGGRGCGAEVRVGRHLRRGVAARRARRLRHRDQPRHRASGAERAGDFAANDRVRREGTPIWVAACRGGRRDARMVQQSIAMVNAGGGDAWADEKTLSLPPTRDVAGGAIAAALAMEAAVEQLGPRLADPARRPLLRSGHRLRRRLVRARRAGKLRLPGEGTDFVSLVHIADMAAATLARSSAGRRGRR